MTPEEVRKILQEHYRIIDSARTSFRADEIKRLSEVSASICASWLRTEGAIRIVDEAQDSVRYSIDDALDYFRYTLTSSDGESQPGAPEDRSAADKRP